MKAIKLQNSNLCAIVDDADYSVLSEYVWHYRNREGKTFAERYIFKRFKAFTGNQYSSRRMHVEIMGVGHIVHLNGNTLDNRRANLAPRPRKEGQA